MKKKLDIKKLILLNLPYVFAFYFVDKLAAVFRLAPGTEFIDKLTGGFANFGAAFANPLPSFHPVDLLIGAAGGALLKLAVYIKGKNRKKFRQGEEYGSARWGRPEDIRPYMDDDFSNNVILTQTEGLTMNSRPKQPKYARNKNILVIGGSGSGKTRFFEMCIRDREMPTVEVDGNFYIGILEIHALELSLPVISAVSYTHLYSLYRTATPEQICR